MIKTSSMKNEIIASFGYKKVTVAQCYYAIFLRLSYSEASKFFCFSELFDDYNNKIPFHPTKSFSNFGIFRKTWMVTL